jgi:hypothetical protein
VTFLRISAGGFGFINHRPFSQLTRRSGNRARTQRTRPGRRQSVSARMDGILWMDGMDDGRVEPRLNAE